MARKLSLFVWLVCFWGIVSASAAASSPALRPATDAYALIAEVNALRASSGLPPYQVNATLMAVAQAHTQYQADTGTVTHYSADGSRPFQRALAAGYPVGGDLSLGGFYSENIMAGTNLTPAGAVQAWTGDAPHLNTMLSPNLTEVGAGVVAVGNYVYYTLDAAYPAGGSVSYTPPAEGTPADSSGALPTLDWIMPVVTSTPLESGAVVHVVQVGQSLWMIADVYQTTVERLQTLNGLGADAVLYPGQELLVIPAAVTATDVPPTITELPSATATSLPIFTPSAAPTEAGLSTRVPRAVSTAEDMLPVVPSADGGLQTVFVIILAALGLAGLVTWLSGREQD